MFLIASMPFVWNLHTERYFSADGAGYFQSLVENGWFQDFAWSRNHAAYLSQWPIVLGVKLGVTDFGWLKLLFGLGLILPCLVSFLLCWIFVEKEDTVLLLLPILSLLSLTLAGDSIMTGEHHILVYLVWPILILLLRKRPFEVTSGMVLLILMVAHLKLYESALATGSLFAVLILFRMFLGVDAGGKQMRLHVVLLALAIGSILIAVHAVVLPRDPTNKGHFLAALFTSLLSQTFLTTAAFIVPAILGMVFREVRLIWVGLLCFMVLAAIWLLDGQPTYASISFSSRALTLWYLPLLMALAVGLLHVSSSRSWLDFRQKFQAQLHNGEGFIRVEDTDLLDDPHRWGWTTALLSYYWSEGKVRAIILNAENIGWEPFDPRNEQVLDGVITLDADFQIRSKE